MYNGKCTWDEENAQAAVAASVGAFRCGMEPLPGPNEYASWDSVGDRNAYMCQVGKRMQQAPACVAEAAVVNRTFTASNDRCSNMLRVNGVVVEGFAPALTSFALVEHEVPQLVAGMATEKARRLGDPGFYATAFVGGRTQRELGSMLQEVLKLPDAAASLVYASFDELSSGSSEIATALAVLEPLFRAFELEAEESLGYSGIVSDARVRKSSKVSAEETQNRSPEPYLQFHVDPPIVGPMFTWSFVRKFGSRPITLDRSCEDILARCRARLPALDKLLLRLADGSVEHGKTDCTALTLEMLLAVPELRQECSVEGFTYQVNRRVAQNLLQNAPESTTGAELTVLKRRSMTGHVGGQLNCWYQLNTSSATCSGKGSVSSSGNQKSEVCTATQPSLGFLPRDCTARVLRTCNRQDPFVESATDEVAGTLREQIEAVGMHFFPENSPGRALVWDGQRVLHSAIYYRQEDTTTPIAQPQIDDTRASLEMRYTTLSLSQIEEYSRGMLQEMCVSFVSE